MPRPRTVRRRRATLDDAERVIQRRLADGDLDLAYVAAEVGVSARQLQRVFREEGQETFRAALLRVRMERARLLLEREHNPLPVVRVSTSVGYSKPSGLRQAFLRYWGINPSEVQGDAPGELYAEVRDI